MIWLDQNPVILCKMERIFPLSFFDSMEHLLLHLPYEDENDYYGILKDVIELAYPSTSRNKVVLFECEWFNPSVNRGTRVHQSYKIIEIHHTRRYERFDSFIITSSARQVYYVPYPGRIKDKVQWWVVVKSNTRNHVEIDRTLEFVFQDDDSSPVDLLTTLTSMPLCVKQIVFSKNLYLNSLMMTMIMFPIMIMKQIMMKMMLDKSCELVILFMNFLSLCKYVVCIICAILHYFYRCHQED